MHTRLPRRAIIVVIAVLTVTVSQASARTATDRSAPIDFTGMPSEFVAAATWATDLFEEAGLGLAPIRSRWFASTRTAATSWTPAPGY
jgi:hypothetical protein